MDEIREIEEALERFNKERDWDKNQQIKTV